MVQIESWPVDPDAPRQWTESSPQAKGKIQHVLAHLRANAIYEVKANGKVIASLPADQAGRVQFTYKHGYDAAQKFEMNLAIQ